MNTDQQSLDHGNPAALSTTTYGKRVDEAKSLIKQLEAYKSLAAPPSQTQDSSTVVETKDTDGNVSISKRGEDDSMTNILLYV